jgi:hypothetical protein
MSDGLFVSQGMLATLRAEADNLLPERVTIQENTQTVDAAGYLAIAWVVRGADIPARFDPLNRATGDAIIGAGLPEAQRYQLTLPYNAPLGVGYRVLRGAEVYVVNDCHALHTSRVFLRATVTLQAGG